MKNRTWIALLALLLLPCLALTLWLLRPQEAAAQAQILSGGQVVKVVNLWEDQILTIPAPKGGENTITVQSGKIAVTAATCPDHTCMAQGYRDRGMQIVCLPNELVIRFLSNQEVDAAT